MRNLGHKNLLIYNHNYCPVDRCPHFDFYDFNIILSDKIINRFFNFFMRTIKQLYFHCNSPSPYNNCLLLQSVWIDYTTSERGYEQAMRFLWDIFCEIWAKLWGWRYANGRHTTGANFLSSLFIYDLTPGNASPRVILLKAVVLCPISQPVHVRYRVVQT